MFIRKNWKMKGVALGLCLAVGLLSGCGTTDGAENSSLDKETELSQPTQNVLQEASGQQENEASEQTATLYIGSEAAGFSEYPVACQEYATPEMLLQGISDLTGWNLSLADEITTGKGGMTVVFSAEACLFTGPPMEQKEEFHVYDSVEFTFMVLDSIQKTLQNWASPTNPDVVDIYYAMEGDVSLELTSLGVTWPLDKPYSHSELEALLG